MFKMIKENDYIYILKDGDDLQYYECTVTSVIPDSANMNDTLKGIYSPITILAKDGTNEFKLDRINSMYDYLEVKSGDEMKIISTDKSKINEYVKKVHDDAKMHVLKIDTYKNKIKSGDDIILRISTNPKDTSEIRFDKLENNVSELSQNIKELLGKLQPKEENKEVKE